LPITINAHALHYIPNNHVTSRFPISRSLFTAGMTSVPVWRHGYKMAANSGGLLYRRLWTINQYICGIDSILQISWTTMVGTKKVMGANHKANSPKISHNFPRWWWLGKTYFSRNENTKQPTSMVIRHWNKWLQRLSEVFDYRFQL